MGKYPPPLPTPLLIMVTVSDLQRIYDARQQIFEVLKEFPGAPVSPDLIKISLETCQIDTAFSYYFIHQVPQIEAKLLGCDGIQRETLRVIQTHEFLVADF